ncbi:hypothetical protein DJ84_11075 [Halorubrum ezzemoulense]|nr:hypothetical protein DJ84_11075 [Halorubrum ezzemoulense]
MASNNQAGALGGCPICGAAVQTQHEIIQYSTTAGELGRWAECPGCGEVVDPSSDTANGS